MSIKTKLNRSRIASVLACVCGVIAVTSTVRAEDAPPPPKSLWDTSAALGLTLTRGNSDTVLFTANIKTETKRPQYELIMGADATYGEDHSVKNNENVHGFAQFNYLFTDRFYGYGRVDGLHDAVAEINYRFTFGPGAGYYFIKNNTTHLSVEGGPALVVEQVVENAGTTNEVTVDNRYFTLRLAEKFDHKLNDKAKIWQSVEILPQVDDFNNFIVNAEAGIETTITLHTGLRVYVQDTYDNVPAEGRKKNDVKLVSALTWKF